jgi:hypothetical protein
MKEYYSSWEVPWYWSPWASPLRDKLFADLLLSHFLSVFQMALSHTFAFLTVCGLVLHVFGVNLK